MSINRTNTYSLDAHVAEIYDGVETQTDDVKLIRRLIAGRGRLRILEPFCGTGRILIPLASDGHEIVGFDQSAPMLDRAGNPYTDSSSRALFFARKPQQASHCQISPK